ncbi:unnamed protein product [Protopolystoma xenopodis]|uniref:Uncharacterized protein n=1 Tax=Protopolystoma xenopodis TaxID=117903 RepID=A0A448XBK4_9PLAT|nr:unnamed protein product [Protopolystoma xenopodis]
MLVVQPSRLFTVADLSTAGCPCTPRTMASTLYRSDISDSDPSLNAGCKYGVYTQSFELCHIVFASGCSITWPVHLGGPAFCDETNAF